MFTDYDFLGNSVSNSNIIVANNNKADKMLLPSANLSQTNCSSNGSSLDSAYAIYDLRESYM